MIAVATYTNKAAKATYNLSFEVPKGMTALERAWQLANTAAKLNCWDVYDISRISIN